MIVLVTGDRNWQDWWAICEVLSQYDGDVTLVHGGAAGADLLASDFADGMGWQVRAEPADWRKHGKRAGPIRNQLMLDKYHPDVVHAFHDNLAASKGTADMVARARKAGIPVTIHASSISSET